MTYVSQDSNGTYVQEFYPLDKNGNRISRMRQVSYYHTQNNSVVSTPGWYPMYPTGTPAPLGPPPDWSKLPPPTGGQWPNGRQGVVPPFRP